ncbi:MAG: hypothetical protein U0746_17070 [Gemmataceae bacterium]
MRKRRRLALLAVALLGVVAWLVWPRSSAVITAAKEKYARLQLGMPESEAVAILGDSPEVDSQLYGEWADTPDGGKWYRLTDPNTRKPKPGERLFNWRAYTFIDGDPRSGWSSRSFQIQVYFDQGRLVAAWYGEGRDNAVKRWLRDLPFMPSRPLPFVDDVVVDEGRQAIPPP